MFKILLLTLILAANSAFADTVRVFKNQEYFIALTDKQCQNTPFFKFYTTKDNKLQFEGYWYMHGTNIIMMEKNGETIIVPYKTFDIPDNT